MRLALGLLLLLPRLAAATDVDTCGQEVARGDTGVLVGDLDCSAATGILAAVLIGNHATLQLNGHTITAPPDADGVVTNVSRHGTITGPGTIRGGLTNVVSGYGHLALSDVSLEDATEGAVQSEPGSLELTNVSVNSLGFGVSARKILANGLTVTTAQHDCILGRQLRGSDVTVSGCATGISLTSTARVVRLDDRDNVTVGITAKAVLLEDSTVTGNKFLGAPLDILTRRVPQLVNTTCDVSRQRIGDAVGATWGVCASD
jgi:hypothetical protein